MINYVPCDEYDCYQLIEANPVMEEVLTRRLKTNGCASCDLLNTLNGSRRECMDCIHRNGNPNELTIPHVPIMDNHDVKVYFNEDGDKFSSKIKLYRIAHKFHLGQCPVCGSNTDWNHMVRVYFNDPERLTAGDIEAKYCPLCGKKIEEESK